MVSNASVPGLTSEPASVSRAVVHRVLRQRLGFDGLVVPDSLTAGAISAAGLSLTDAAVRGLAVGEDMVLFTATPDQLASTTHAVVDALVTAVADGGLGRRRLEAAVTHVLAAKGVDLCAS
jgi:beta-N-acetylhexosaminidase